MNILGYEISEKGCGNHSCFINPPKGQGTNGGCSCFRDVPSKDRIEVTKVVVAMMSLKRKSR